jgi:hypothetical protein
MKSLPEIGRELHVQAVVEGSVMKSGDRVRITAQLVEASKDRHLWAGRLRTRPERCDRSAERSRERDRESDPGSPDPGERAGLAHIDVVKSGRV